MYSMLVIIFIIYYHINYFTYSYFTSCQWKTINSILTKPNYYTISQKQYINNLIYKNYEIWALTQAIKFKQFHNHKCYNIKNEELKLSAKIGLHKAISYYDPSRLTNVTFASYAYIYIRSELYKCITELHPITTVSKYERRKSFVKRQNKEIIIMPLFSSIYQQYMMDKYNKKKYDEQHNNLNYHELWNKIEYDVSISYKIKQIVKLKFSYEFQQKRSNKQISEIFGCSEETIRQQLIQFKNQLNKKIH